MNIHVCAVTVAYNSLEELKRLLASLTGQYDSLCGLVVVDNSDDAYLAANRKIFDSYSRRYAFSRYVATGENVGSAGGFRRGMEIAHKIGFDWVWLLDQDGAASPGCLDELLKRSGEGDILCPNIVDIDRPAATIPMTYTTNFLGRGYPSIWCSTGCQIRACGTHATLISKKALDTIGYYDDSFFFVGFEDGDYSHRAVQAGLTIVQVLQAEAQHPNLIRKNAERLLNRALNERQQAKHGEETLWSGEDNASLNEKELSRILARKTPQSVVTITKLFPTFLGYITDADSQGTPCSRTRSIAAFSRVYSESKRLKSWQLGIALVYSICVALCLKILRQRRIALKMTLHLYVTCLTHRLKGDWPYTSIEQLCHKITKGRQ